MSVSAILVIGDGPSFVPAKTIDNSVRLDRGYSAPASMPCTEILGESVLDRTVTRLRKQGVSTISVVARPGSSSLCCGHDVEVTVADGSIDPWRTAQRLLVEQMKQGVQTAIVMVLGAYMEFSLQDVLEFHSSHGRPLTQLFDGDGPLEFWCVEAKWLGAAGVPLPFREGEFPGLPVLCPIQGYVNRLEDARDLRRLVQDALLGRCEFWPRGRQLRPGVWVDEGVRVHRTARLVAPVYLGRSTKVGASAVITRFSNLEKHSGVGHSTIVDAASLLPHTVMGNGLDVSHAVIEGNRFLDLRRNVVLQIADPKLVRDTTPRQWRNPAAYSDMPLVGEDSINMQNTHYITRVAGRLSGVFFKG